MTRLSTKRTRQVTDNILVSITCDLCGVTTEDYPDWPDLDAQGNNIQMTEVRMERGWSAQYGGEGGSKMVTSYDICPRCFEEKLMPWLASQGAKPTTEEVDW